MDETIHRLGAGLPQPSPDDFNGERMQPRRKLVRQRGVDLPVLLKSRLAHEPRGGDANPKMALAFGPRASMAGVARAFVDDFKMAWREFDRKFFNNDIANGHMSSGSLVPRLKF